MANRPSTMTTLCLINSIQPGLFLGALARSGEERRKAPAAHNSKIIHGIEMKFGRVVESRKLINLVQFNWRMTSSLRHNDVITVEILDFHEILPIKIRKAYRCF